MRRLLAFLSAFALFAVLMPQSAADASVGHIQSWLRAERGGMGTTFCGDIAGYAQRRANEMAAARSIWHGSDLGSNSNWKAISEIVGTATTAEGITSAWRSSSSHRGKYMQARFVEAGVGLAQGSDGYLYSSVVLRDPTTPCGGGGGAAPAPAPPAAAPGVPAAPRAPRLPGATRPRSTAVRPVAAPLPPPPPPELPSQVRSALSVTRVVSDLSHFVPPEPVDARPGWRRRF